MNPIDWHDRDRAPDPLLAGITDAGGGPSPEPDWARLRHDINGRAAPHLARRAARRNAFLPRPVLGFAVAAGVAFALWIGPAVVVDVLERPAAEAANGLEDDLLGEVLGADLSEQEFRLLVTGRANPDVLLAVAIGQP